MSSSSDEYNQSNMIWEDREENPKDVVLQVAEANIALRAAGEDLLLSMIRSQISEWRDLHSNPRIQQDLAHLLNALPEDDGQVAGMEIGIALPPHWDQWLCNILQRVLDIDRDRNTLEDDTASLMAKDHPRRNSHGRRSRRHSRSRTRSRSPRHPSLGTRSGIRGGRLHGHHSHRHL